MPLVVGVDIGNSTTEACAAEVGADGSVTYLGGVLAPTSGIKGTVDNVPGVARVVREALAASGRAAGDLAAVLVNEATPVISGLAMETITETIITESTMIGHNPDTPGGAGLGVGTTVAFPALGDRAPGDEVICVVGEGIDFEDAAEGINAALARGVLVTGAVVHADDATLIANRLRSPVPVVDEVTLVDRVPLGMLAAVEVTEAGRTVRTLSNSYGIATVFGLDAAQTRMIAPVARALVGNRSAVVVRTPDGDVTDRRIPAGSLTLVGEQSRRSVGMDAGAAEIMADLRRVTPLTDAEGEPGTHVGGMLARVRDTMSELTGTAAGAVRCGAHPGRAGGRHLRAAVGHRRAGRGVRARNGGGAGGDGTHEPRPDAGSRGETACGTRRGRADRRGRGGDGGAGRVDHAGNRPAGRDPRPRWRLDRRGCRRRTRRRAVGASGGCG